MPDPAYMKFCRDFGAAMHAEREVTVEDIIAGNIHPAFLCGPAKETLLVPLKSLQDLLGVMVANNDHLRGSLIRIGEMIGLAANPTVEDVVTGVRDLVDDFDDLEEIMDEDFDDEIDDMLDGMEDEDCCDDPECANFGNPCNALQAGTALLKARSPFDIFPPGSVVTVELPG